MPGSFPERLSKAATLAAVALAFPVHLTVDPAVGWTLRVIAAAAFAAAFVCARRWPSTTVAVVVGAGPILPALLAASLHVAALNAFYTVWLAALFGAMLPGMPRDRWELPRAWRIPLGVWALTLSLAWPVLIVREAGLRLGMLRDTGALDSWAYLNTPQVESWILHVVLAQLVALLWLEWLFRPGSGIWAGIKGTGSLILIPDPSPLAVHGLWIGASIASVVAIYQGTVNMAFLSGGIWPGLRRAAGTLLDANAYGTVAALAGPIAFVSIPSLRIRHTRLAQAAALALNWGGAWMSGSRTAFVCGAFGTLLLVYELLRESRLEGRRDDAGARDTPSLLAGVAVVVLLLAVGAGAIGPLKRMTEGAERLAARSVDARWIRQRGDAHGARLSADRRRRRQLQLDGARLLAGDGPRQAAVRQRAELVAPPAGGARRRCVAADPDLVVPDRVARLHEAIAAGRAHRDRDAARPAVRHRRGVAARDADAEPDRPADLFLSRRAVRDADANPEPRTPDPGSRIPDTAQRGSWAW